MMNQTRSDSLKITDNRKTDLFASTRTSSDVDPFSLVVYLHATEVKDC